MDDPWNRDDEETLFLDGLLSVMVVHERNSDFPVPDTVSTMVSGWTDVSYSWCTRDNKNDHSTA